LQRNSSWTSARPPISAGFAPLLRSCAKARRSPRRSRAPSPAPAPAADRPV